MKVDVVCSGNKQVEISLITDYGRLHAFLPSEEGFWPLTASITSDVKNNYVHVKMEGILNKISEINFSVGCMVWS